LLGVAIGRPECRIGDVVGLRDCSNAADRTSTAPGDGAGRHRPGASRLERTWSPRAHTWPRRSLHRHSEHTRCATGVQRRGRSLLPRQQDFSSFQREAICAVRCTGRTPRDRDHAARGRSRGGIRGRAGSSVGSSEASAEGLSLPALIDGRRTQGSHALSLRSKRHGRLHRWALQSRGWGRDGAALHHPFAAMEPDSHHSHRLAFSCWFHQSTKLLRSEDSAVRTCWGRRLKPSMPNRC
jgi:hypothetical protein